MSKRTYSCTKSYRSRNLLVTVSYLSYMSILCCMDAIDCLDVYRFLARDWMEHGNSDIYSAQPTYGPPSSEDGEGMRGNSMLVLPMLIHHYCLHPRCPRASTSGLLWRVSSLFIVLSLNECFYCMSCYLAHFTSDGLCSGSRHEHYSQKTTGPRATGIATITAILDKGVGRRAMSIMASTCLKRLAQYPEGVITCLSSHLSFLSSISGLALLIYQLRPCYRS